MGDPETKTCPDCKESVKHGASVCRYCGHEFETPTAGAVDTELFSARIAAGVSTTALMTAVDVFLVGALLAAHNASAHRYGAALLLLVVSGVGFLYGTLIYANSYMNITNPTKFGRQMDCGNIVSEAFGVCPLVLAVPLAVAAVTSSSALAWSTFGISAFAFGVYQLSNYSLLRRARYIGKWSYLLSFVVLAVDAVGVTKLRSPTSTEVRLVSAGVMVAALAVAALIGIISVQSN
jgi:hypothetical protein